MTYLWLAIGGAIGTVARYAVSSVVYDRTGIGPAGIFVANITGSLLIGFLAVLFADRVDVSDDIRRFTIVGILGGYTTFSTLAYDTTRYIEDGDLARAALNGVGSLIAGVIAVFVGMLLAKSL